MYLLVGYELESRIMDSSIIPQQTPNPYIYIFIFISGVHVYVYYIYVCVTIVSIWLF